MRQTDTVARHGGDEFTLLLPDLHQPEDAAQVAEKILERVAEPRPSDETVRACPDMQDAQVVAYFLHLRVRKP